jgi:hypothetical protein
MSRWGQLDSSDLYAPKYFTESEIKQYENPYMDESYDKDIIINGWLKVADDYLLTVVNIGQIYEWFNLCKIKYNENTQKKLVIKESKGVMIRVLRIAKEAISSIIGLFKKDEFIPDDITININPETNPDCLHIEKDKIVISKDATIDLIDGMHQYISMTEYKSLHPEWDYNTEVRVVAFNDEKANRYILQRNNKNHLTDEEKTEKKQDEANFVINRLNDSFNFILKGTVKDKLFVINKILNQLFNLDKNDKTISRIEHRQNSIKLANTIEKNINLLVERKKINVEFSNEMWFISLYLIYYCQLKEIDFEYLINNINLDELSKKIVFKKFPTPSNIKIINEVISNVL